MNAKKHEIVNQGSYAKFLDHIKQNIQTSQLRAAMAITKELIELYWRIGKMLSEKASLESWAPRLLKKSQKI